MENSVAKRKILMLTENFPPVTGGSGRWFWELYSRMPVDEVLILANDDKSLDTAEFDRATELNIIRTSLSSTQWGFKSLIGLKFYYKKFIEIKALVKKHQIDEIHCGRVIHEGVIAWLVSKFTNVRYCCYVHGEDVETAATSGEHNLMVKQVCKGANYLICNSQNSANIVKHLNYAKDEKLHVLNPGVDSKRFMPSDNDDMFKEKMEWKNKFVILTVGRLQERKGHHKMIEALPSLLNKHQDVLYVVIGEGDRKESLVGLTEKLKLETKVQFLSEIDDQDMIRCYQQCDLFILPNITVDRDIEGFGMVLVEAQSCGKLVIAGDSGGTKETMLVGKTGAIVDCNDPQKLALFLSDLLDDREKLKSMGTLGRQHVATELDWIAHTKRAKEIFDSYPS